MASSTTGVVEMFPGMRGTGDWVTDERPKDWREGILYLYPNGMAPLTALLAKMRSSSVKDPEYYWWTKSLSRQGGAITGIYTDDTLSTPYVYGTGAGDKEDELFFKMAALTASNFRIGHTVVIRYSADHAIDVIGYVTGKGGSAANSYVKVQLREAEKTNTDTAAKDTSDADVLLVTGSANAEGADMPAAIAGNPLKIYNKTQIFRDSLELTRTAMATKLRTKAAYDEARRECLQYHSISMEKAYINGILDEWNDPVSGKPVRMTQGIIPTIRTYAEDYVFDYRRAAAFAGKTWLQGGREWLNSICAQIFTYGDQTRLVYCGRGALLGINALVEDLGTFNFTTTTMAYGIKVTRWETPFGSLLLKTHPLFNLEPSMRNMMLFIDTNNIQERYIQRTKFKSDKSLDETTGGDGRDGKKEEFITECGLELHFPETFGVAYGVGEANILTP